MYRITKKIDDIPVPTPVYILTFDACQLPGEVYIGFTACHVREYTVYHDLAVASIAKASTMAVALAAVLYLCVLLVAKKTTVIIVPVPHHARIVT